MTRSRHRLVAARREAYAVNARDGSGGEFPEAATYAASENSNAETRASSGNSGLARLLSTTPGHGSVSGNLATAS